MSQFSHNPTLSWHTKFGRLMPHLRELTIVSAAPAATLGGISRDLEILHVHDSAVTDIGYAKMLTHAIYLLSNFFSKG